MHSTDGLASSGPPIVVLILFLTIGGSVLWVGMIWDCAVASERSVRSKVLRLILVIPTPNLGALIYYFLCSGAGYCGKHTRRQSKHKYELKSLS